MLLNLLNLRTVKSYFIADGFDITAWISSAFSTVENKYNCNTPGTLSFTADMGSTLFAG